MTSPGTVRTEVIRAAPPFQGYRDEVTLLPPDIGGDFLRTATTREDTQIGKNSSATVFIVPVRQQIAVAPVLRRPPPAWRVWPPGSASSWLAHWSLRTASW